MGNNCLRSIMTQKKKKNSNRQKGQVLDKAATKFKQIEEKNHIENAYLDGLFEGAPEAIVMTDKDGHILRVNKEFIRMFGYSSKEALGRSVDGLIAPKGYRSNAVSITKQTSRGEKFSLETVRQHKDGTLIPVSLRTSPIAINDKQVAQYGIYRDIAEKKKIEETLRQKTHDLSERVKELNCLYAIDELSRKEGITIDEMFKGAVRLICKSWQYPEITECRITLWDKVFKSKNFVQIKWIQKSDTVIDDKKVGSVEVCYLEEKPESDEGPFLKEERSLIDAIAERLGQILEHKQTEETLRENEEKYRTLVENATDFIYMIDRNFRVLSLNKAGARLFRKEPEEIIGKLIFDLFPKEIATNYAKNLKRVFQTAKSFFSETRMIVGNRESWISVNLSPVRDHSGEVIAVIGVTRDITEHKQAEEAIQKEATKLTAMISGMEEGIVFADSQDQTVEVNDYFLNLFNKNRSEVLGKSLWDCHSDQAVKNLRRYLKKFKSNPNSPPAVIQKSIGNLETILRLQPIYRNDKYDGIILNIIDVTELVVARQEAQAASRTKSEFLANMSHEIRTPLSGIFGMTDLMLDTNLSKEQQEYLEAIHMSAKSLMDIIGDILDFSKIEAKKIELDAIKFDLRDSISNTVSSLRLQAHKKGLELVLHIPSDIVSKVIGDPGRLRQILINLINNSIKFTEKGDVVVSVKQKEKTEDRVCLQFTIKDTGIGIPKEKQKTIFDSFAQVDGSTSRKYGGTGLGLAISSQLVELMGGRIWVESKVGKGSSFHFTANFNLPQETEKRPVLSSLSSLKNLPVLVVDDNATNRFVLEETLLNWGMNSYAVSTGRAALRELKRAERGEKGYALVLIDSYMPGMDGFSLAEKIKSSPNLSETTVIMLTSGGARGDAARCRQLGISAYLMKPVKQSDLLDAIMMALGTPAKSRDRIPLITRHSLRESRLALRILLVEDNIINQKLTTRILEKQGHSVVVANNGKEAIDHLKRQNLDLILMDVQMPEMDGFEATAAIREKEKKTGGHIPIVAMTAHAMTGDRERCLKAGMDDYLSKPLKPDHLVEVIHGIFEPARKL